MPDTAHVPADPFGAVRGWQQDYWMMRLLDVRGLDTNAGGGPHSPLVGERKARALVSQFRNFAERLAALGWVIVWQPSEPGAPAAVRAIPVDDWRPGVDAELPELGGLVGEALGLAAPIARAAYSSSVEAMPSGALVTGAALLANAAAHPPAYPRLSTKDASVLQILEDLVARPGTGPLDLAELEAAADAAALG